MAKFLMQENVIGSVPDFTARLGAGTGSSNWVSDKEVGKFVKYVADSRYDLCAAGDPIQGHVTSVEPSTLDNYSIGSVRSHSRKEVTFDGLQATPGTGTIAVGDYVVTGTVVAKGTALTGPAKVCKATNQPGTAVDADTASADTAAAVNTILDAALVLVASQMANALYAWRVVSLGAGGVGTVGGVGVIERVNS